MQRAPNLSLCPFNQVMEMDMARIARLLRQFGPLMLIELLLPGGTLIAGAIYFLRRNAD